MKLTLGVYFLVTLTLSVASTTLGQQQPPSTTRTNSARDKIDLQLLMQGTNFTNSVGMVMVKISPNLWAGKYPVRQVEYRAVVGSNPSEFQGDNNPVENVSWNEANAFFKRLNQKETKELMLPDGFTYSLPTQAQWEQLVDGADLKDAVTSQAGNRKNTAPVGSLGANDFGLYDMRGNVWEWCLDPQDKPFRVLRGGAWNSFIEVNLRPEFRWYSNGPDDKRNNYGFRCVMQPK